MLFCEKCGEQLTDNEPFCPKCGNALLPYPVQLPRQQVQNNKPNLFNIRFKLRKKTVIIFISVITLIAIAITLFCVLLKSNEPTYLLNKKEKEIYNALLLGLEPFYNMNEARLVDIGKEEIKAEKFRTILLKMKLIDRAGVTSTEKRVLILESHGSLEYGTLISNEDLEIDDIFWQSGDGKANVGKINKALIKYWKSKGIK